jgi:hypothetical protein
LEICKYFGALAKLRKATISFVTSVRLSAWNNLAPNGRIFMTFDIPVLFENLFGKFKFYCNLTRVMSTLHEDQYTFLIIFRSDLLRMRNITDKSCREKSQHTFNVQLTISENRAVCEIMWKNIVESKRPQMTT